MSERTYTESELTAERAALLREIDVELAVAYDEANLLRCNEELAGNVVKHAHATGTMNGLNVARTVVSAIPTDQSALARVEAAAYQRGKVDAAQKAAEWGATGKIQRDILALQDRGQEAEK